MVFIDHLLNLVLDEEVNDTLYVLRGRDTPAPFRVHLIYEGGVERLLLNLVGWLYYGLGLVILLVVVIILVILLGMLKERLLSCCVVVRALHVRLGWPEGRGLLIRLPVWSFLPNIDLLVREIEYVLVLLARLGSHRWIQLMDHIVLMNVKIIHHLDLLNIVNVKWILHLAAPTAP